MSGQARSPHAWQARFRDRRAQATWARISASAIPSEGTIMIRKKDVALMSLTKQMWEDIWSDNGNSLRAVRVFDEGV